MVRSNWEKIKKKPETVQVTDEQGYTGYGGGGGSVGILDLLILLNVPVLVVIRRLLARA